jgi:hypothetical protein
MNQRISLESERYIKQEPFVDDRGVYIPVNEYVREGYQSQYRCILTKEMFVEAYNKWIKNDSVSFVGQDDADDWSED